jgi:hypothetical protein
MSVNATALSSFNSALNTTNAINEGGYNNWFPDPGSYDCSLEAITLNECNSKEWIDGVATEHPAIMIKFVFRLIDDPGQPDSPRSFEGSPFILPNAGPDAFSTEQALNRLQKTMGRLKGHLTKVLGMSDVPDLGASLQAAMDKLQTEPVMVKVETTSYTSNKGNTYNTEFIKDTL